jgi:hypothetical protein
VAVACFKIYISLTDVMSSQGRGYHYEYRLFQQSFSIFLSSFKRMSEWKSTKLSFSHSQIKVCKQRLVSSDDTITVSLVRKSILSNLLSKFH